MINTATDKNLTESGFLAGAGSGTAQEGLRVSNERYREVLESQTELVCRYLHDTTLTFVNEAYCHCFGRTRNELIGQKFLELIPTGARERVRSGIASLTTKGQVITNEHEVILPDGAVGWQLWTNQAIVGPDGEITEFQAIGRDITDRKRVETELTEKLRLQRLLADLSSRFVAVQPEDLDAVIEEAQRLIVETLGLDRSILWQIVEHGSDMVPTHSWRSRDGQPIPSPSPTEESLPWSYAKMMRGEIISFSKVDELPAEAAGDVETFRAHGAISALAIPLVADKRVFGALAFATLNGERKWQEDEIIELKLLAQIIGNVIGRQRAELREEQLRSEFTHAMRVATLGELVATIAHELNQPLAAILSNAQAARRFLADGAIEPDELREILDDVVRDNKRAGNVIHNLRAMVSKRPVIREACCLNELVREVIELIRSETIEAKIEVHLVLALQLPHVQGARVELQQVLVNLLINAVQAMKATPPELRFIDVETRAEANVVVVTVRDRGHGIPTERLASIFNSFFSTKVGGLGMGLSICRRIIENHGGRIEARNHVNGGAAFSFTLPIPVLAAK